MTKHSKHHDDQPEPTQPEQNAAQDTTGPQAVPVDPAAPPAIENTDAAREAVEQQIAELTAALQRERADAMNIRRQHSEQLASATSTAKAHIVRKLLPVIDNFERALKHVPADLEGNDYVKGIQGIVKQFEKTLADLGVERIKTVGEPFNPHLHEAISMEEGDGDQEIVSEELQSGYVMGDEVLRHAMVRVKAA